jgi:type VI secretion system protein ImpJ
MSLHKVIWQEGMLLRPQHFQQSDRYHDYQMKFRTRLSGSFQWGFLDLVIDPQPLLIGQIVISRASGVLPDGSVFELAGDKPMVLEVPANTGDTGVFLALPLTTGDHVEARRAEQTDVFARYTAYQVQVADSNAGESAKPLIDCARPEFQLLLGEPSSQQAVVTLKLCHIFNTTPDKAVTLSPEFSASFLHAHASPYLTACLNEVIGMLGLRGNAIGKRMRASGSVGGAELGDFLMLQLINRTELVLQHYLTLEQLHPERLYCTLLALLGDLATFSREDKRPQLTSRYQHSDQGASFRGLMSAIRQALSMVLERHALELELQARDFGVTVCPRVDKHLLESMSLVMAVSAHCDADQLRQALAKHLKIGAVESIRGVVQQQLPGITFRALPVAPRQIPFHANKSYFILEMTVEQQADVDRSGGLAFYLAQQVDGLELQLWAIRN